MNKMKVKMKDKMEKLRKLYYPLIILCMFAMIIGMIIYSSVQSYTDAERVSRWINTEVQVGNNFKIIEGFSDKVSVYEEYSDRGYKTYLFRDIIHDRNIYVTVSTSNNKITRIIRQLIL